MDNDDLTVIIAAHDKEIQGLRDVIEVQRQMLDALGEGIEALHDAMRDLPKMARMVVRDHELVARHDRTLRAMHTGLHDTTDPNLQH